MTETNLRDEIRAMAKGWEMLGAVGPRLIPETVLHAGIDCVPQPLPKRYKRRMVKRCYANAAEVVRRSGRLTYVEGLAKSATTGLVVDHAWAIDDQKRVIDPTWEQAGLAYVGVPIDLATYDELTLFSESASAFQGNIGLRVAFLLKLNPGLADILPKSS